MTIKHISQESFTRVNNDVNGNPRYVCHFLSFIKDEENIDVFEKYEIAIKRSKQFDGKKFHNKRYGGGIVFSTYSLEELVQMINKYLEEN